MNKEGYFGNFGGRFVPEALRPPLMELEEAMATIMPSREYRDALQDLLVNYAGRETPLTFCPHLSEKLGFRLWLKREDLLHTGAHKINNALGQALLAKMMGKRTSLRKPGRGSTAWLRPRRRPGSRWTAPSSWGRRTWSASP